MRLALHVLVVLSTSAASAQIGVAVKASGGGGQLGVDLPLGDRVGLRAVTSLGIDSDVGGVLTAAVPIRFPNGGPTVPYVAPSVTVLGFDEIPYVGALVGVEHTLTNRVVLFGEAGLDAAIDESYTTLTTGPNTGVGAIYRF